MPHEFLKFLKVLHPSNTTYIQLIRFRNISPISYHWPENKDEHFVTSQL